MISINTNALYSLNIPNFKPITLNSETIGFRGATLSAQKRRWMLKEIRLYGIHTYADLRAGDHSDSFPLACKDADIRYLHLPTDKFRTPDTVIISNLFVLAEMISAGGFYISCALGLHRTDMALSLNYLFNPKINEPPILYAPLDDGRLRYRDIFGRAGSVYRTLTEKDKESLGWGDLFDYEYVNRKEKLKKHQEEATAWTG